MGAVADGRAIFSFLHQWMLHSSLPKLQQGLVRGSLHLKLLHEAFSDLLHFIALVGFFVRL